MALYSIEWKRSAYRDLKKIDKQYLHRILKEIESLARNPHPQDCQKLVDTERTFRIRVGDYRVVYQADDRAGVVLVEHIRHRKDVYRNL